MENKIRIAGDQIVIWSGLNEQLFKFKSLLGSFIRFECRLAISDYVKIILALNLRRHGQM